MRKLFSIATGIIFTYSANSQSPPEQDCLGAIPIAQTTYSQTNAFFGTGNIPNEINPALSCLKSGEKNDVWYSYCVLQSGNLCFSIIPNVATDDYDWAVFNLTNDSCSSIYNDSAIEVGCNYSSATGTTGPNGLSGSQNGPCISVGAGEKYVMNVSMYSPSTNGYTLNFSASTCLYDSACSTQYAGDTCAMNITMNSQNILCAGNNTGSASVSVSSNYSSSFSYQWSNGQTDSVATGLSAGTYTVIITGSNGCNAARQVTIDSTISAQLVTSTGNYGVSADSVCNGSAVVFVSSGISPYSFQWSAGTQWSNGNNSAGTSNLCAGTYYVTTTDGNGCTKIDSVNIYVTSVNEITSEKYFKIYPNPTTGKISWQLTVGNQQKNNNCSLEIYNVLGERIFQSTNPPATIDLTSQPNGIYFMKLKSGENVFTEKIVKM